MGRGATDGREGIETNGRGAEAPRLDSGESRNDGGEHRSDERERGSDDRGPGSDGGVVEPVRFAEEALGVKLWSKQEEALRAVMEERRVAVKSGNGLGKDFTAAVALLWYLHSHDPGIVLSTAPTFRQVRHVLWRQIRALHRRAAQALGGRMLDTRWELADDRYALGLSADEAERFQGFHSENMLVVVDEAEGIEDEIYEAIDSVMTSENVKLLLIGNPTRPSGPFFRAFHDEKRIYKPITISAWESPNVLKREVEIAGLTTAEWVEERRAIWGEASDAYRSRVLGEFPRLGEDALIAKEDIDEAVYEGWEDGRPDAGRLDSDESRNDRGGRDWSGMFLAGVERWAAGPVVIGMDVARYGRNQTALVVRRGDVVEAVRAFNGIDTMASVGQVIEALREYGPAQVNVDEVGVGGGVVDRLREQGYMVRGMVGSGKPERDLTCANRRAEGYRMLERRFSERRIRIPRDAELIKELTGLRYKYNSQGRMLMDSKRQMRSRGLASPDKADALMLAFLDERPGDFWLG